MKILNKINSLIIAQLSVVAGLLVCLSTSYAAAIYHINVNTSALIGNASAPFSLDFQFNNGSTFNNNTATISNFSYFGGSATGSAFTSDAGVTGDIGSTVVFNNGAAFQELFQTFTPGTKLSFDVSLTTNVEGVTPDSFVFGILDKDTLNIPTTGLGDSLLQIDINGATPQVHAFAGTGAFATVAAVVPEPETLLLVGLGFVGFGVRRKARAQQSL